MSPNPLILAKGAKAVSAATAGAQTARIAMDAKAAKSMAGAFKSIEETTKMGGWENLRGFSENIKNSGPVVTSLKVLGAMWTAETAAANANLMISLIEHITSDGFQEGLAGIGKVVSAIINGTASVVDFATEIGTVDERMEQITTSSKWKEFWDTFRDKFGDGLDLDRPPLADRTFEGGEQQLF